jgi:hypothetical protein
MSGGVEGRLKKLKFGVIHKKVGQLLKLKAESSRLKER